MTPAERAVILKERLQQFQPTKLEIIDDSHKHVGHAGSRDGAGHYTVVIAAACFSNQSRVAAHREIYQVLNDLIPHEVHALKIQIINETSK
jgi:BolA protein